MLLAALALASPAGAEIQFSRSFAAGDGPDAAVADVDDDGVPDIISANRNGDDVSVLLGNGDGSFQAAVSFAVGDGPFGVVVADLDGDGAPDLATSNGFSNDVSVLLGNGDGTFKPASAFATGVHPVSIAATDLDGDTLPDLVTANRDSDDVSVLLGNGDGTFQPAVSFATGGAVFAVAVADLGDDGIEDLVTVHSSAVEVQLGNGDGTFQPATSWGEGVTSSVFVITDFDGDGALDIVTTHSGTGNMSIFLGNGDGSFQAQRSFDSGPYPLAAIVADLDGDGGPDLATANRSRLPYGNQLTDGVYILINLAEPPAGPEIDIRPDSDDNELQPFRTDELPVAILGSTTFDVLDVDVTTLAFGPDGAIAVHDLTDPVVFADHLDDVNGDGFTDLIAHFVSRETGIAKTDTSACLSGSTLTGRSFEACDSIHVFTGRKGGRR